MAADFKKNKRSLGKLFIYACFGLYGAREIESIQES